MFILRPHAPKADPLYPTPSSLSQPTILLSHELPKHPRSHSRPFSLSILTISEACWVKSVLYILCHCLVQACFSFHIHHYNSLLIAFITFNPFLSFFHPLAKLFVPKCQSDHESPCHPNFTACFLEALLTPQENGMWGPSQHQHAYFPQAPTFSPAAFLIVSPWLCEVLPPAWSTFLGPSIPWPKPTSLSSQCRHNCIPILNPVFSQPPRRSFCLHLSAHLLRNSVFACEPPEPISVSGRPKPSITSCSHHEGGTLSSRDSY